MKKYLKPILISVLSMLNMFVATCFVVLCLYIYGNEQVTELLSNKISQDTVFPSELIGYVYVCFAILTAISVKGLKMAEPMSVFNFKSVNRRELWYVIIGAFMLLMGAMSLYLIFNPTGGPGYVTSKFVIGLLLESFFAAYTFELLYRESIIRHLLDNGSSELKTILFSTFCFVAFHFYLPSIFDVLLGLVLAYAYVKTRNVVVSFLIYLFFLLVNNFYITYALEYVADYDFYNICLVLFAVFTIIPSLYLLQKSNISNLTFDDKSV